MGPIIILDKSTLQSLSDNERLFLSKYFILNIPPILIMEIWGDLAKPNKPGTISRDRVQSLASKSHQGLSAINANFIHCIITSLLGEKVLMDRRIILPGGKAHITDAGKKGVVFEETSEEKQLNRWKAGDFESGEKDIAEQWRNASKAIDLEELKKVWGKKFKSRIQLKSLDDVDLYVNKYFTDKNSQLDFLIQVIEDFHIPQEESSKILLRHERSNNMPLSKFAPYAYYCCYVRTFFFFALMYDLVGTRNTNMIDLEYMYYLPFCMVFSSSDKFHQALAPYFINKDQRFICGKELKADLSSLADEWETSFDRDMSSWDRKYKKGPPENAKSIVCQLWKDLFPNWTPGSPSKFETPESRTDEELMEMINEMKNASALNGSGLPLSDSGSDFIIRKRSIYINDPCPCGSGKLFKDCCYEKTKDKNE